MHGCHSALAHGDLVQVCAAIKPESAEMVYLMLLEKSPTQEEFIRGQLTHNPYNSAEVGPLMRDVKNFICRELDMEGDLVLCSVFPFRHNDCSSVQAPDYNLPSLHMSATCWCD